MTMNKTPHDVNLVSPNSDSDLLQIHAGEHDLVSSHRERAQPCYPVDRPWLLCIDDDAEFLLGLKMTLQTRGYDVVRAHEGMEGYKFAFEIDPVMILLDLHMPNTSGEEVLSQLRYHPATSHIPVVIMTGLSEPGLETRLHNLGAYEVFRKPIPFETLADAVDRYLSDPIH